MSCLDYCKRSSALLTSSYVALLSVIAAKYLLLILLTLLTVLLSLKVWTYACFDSLFLSPCLAVPIIKPDSWSKYCRLAWRNLKAGSDCSCNYTKSCKRLCPFTSTCGTCRKKQGDSCYPKPDMFVLGALMPISVQWGSDTYLQCSNWKDLFLLPPFWCHSFSLF